MSRKKTLKIDEVADILFQKPVNTTQVVYKEEGLKFEIKALSEIEMLYIFSESSKHESEVKQNMIQASLAIAFGVVGIEKEVDGEWLKIEFKREDFDVLGEKVKAWELEQVTKLKLTVKQALGEEIIKISELSKGEAFKLELFR